jgi:flagellar biosynthetic protein FliP
MRPTTILVVVLCIGLLLGLCSTTAEAAPLNVPTIQIGVEEAEEPEKLATGLQVLLLLTVLSLAPALLVMVTSFTRVVVVLAFVRNALALQNTPPNQVLIGLALFLTVFIMAPVAQTVHADAWEPYMDGAIGQEQAMKAAQDPLRDFMFEQTREKDLALFARFVGLGELESPDDVPLYVVIPAFVISELKTAFQIGFALFIPFVVIDMIVASTLMSMGMLMLPPMMISLPFKILLFVLVDGWHLLVRSLMLSFS